MSQLHRLLLGEASWWFPLEVLARALVLYFMLVAMLRVLGKRLSGQLTILELGIMITLGAIVSAPMVMPNKGIIVGIVLLACALGFQRGIGWVGVVSERFERFVFGAGATAVKDGVIDLKTLSHAGLSRNVVYAVLRSRGVHHLGEIERLYLEPGGVYTMWRARAPRPGLSVFSDEERQLLEGCRDAPGRAACDACGFTVPERESRGRCPNCREQRWRSAVELVEKA